MTFLLGWPLLIAGMLAAGVPVIIHLLHRQRTTPVMWGAMQFLLDSPLQSRRRRRLDHWLLLLLRTLVLLLLAWALARPLVSGASSGLLGNNVPVDVAVVIDHSLSTGRRAGDRTVFEQAVGIADDVAKTMRPGDTLSIILAEHRPRSLGAVPVSARDSGKLLVALHALGPGMTDCSIPQAVQAAREMLAHGHHSRKLVLVLSDEQRTSWQIGDLTAWCLAVGSTPAGSDDLTIHSIGLAPKAGESDVSVGDVSIEPSLVGINRPARISAVVTNYGPKELAAVNVFLTIDGKETSAPIQVPTVGVGQSSTIKFDHTFTTPGSHSVRIWTDLIDALPADNSAVAAVAVWQKLPVLIIDGQLTRAGNFRSAQFLVAAMQPVDPTRSAAALIQPTVVSAADSPSVNLDDFPVVVLNDVPRLPPEMESRLYDYAAAGHGVWVILGPRTSDNFITSTLGPDHARLAKLSLVEPTPHVAQEPLAIEIKAAANPMIAMIASSERNALAGAVTRQWWSVKSSDPGEQVVLAAGTGEPLILSHPIGGNGGRVAIWSTSADGLWNTWNVMPNFVPLVNETIYYLSAPQTRGQVNGSVPVGGAITWSGPANPPVRTIDITLPDGTLERNRKPTFRSGHWEFQYPGAFMPGLYQLKFNPAVVSPPVYVGVGIDRKELDPAELSDKDHQWLADNKFTARTTADEIPALITRQQGGAELWKWLAALVLLTLLGETALTYRMIGPRKKTLTVA